MELDSLISCLLQQRPIPADKIVKELASASRRGNADDLCVLNRLCMLDDVFDEYVAVPALSLLPAWGIAGLELLVDHAFNGPHKAAALSILAAISEGRCPKATDVAFLSPTYDSLVEYPVPPDVQAQVLRMIQAEMSECAADAGKKRSLLWLINELGIVSETSDERRNHFGFYVDLLIDSHLVVNRSILQQFESLLASGPSREEELQAFLSKHPVLLDPFVVELRSKHQLGDDFKTDYVVRRMNNEYVLVEIENSTDRIFTKDGQFTNALTKALSQVRDFQAWVADNIAYAQKKLPGIRRPEGLVVIGRSSELDEMNAKRLDEENFSRRGHIKVVTFDDLLHQAQTVHNNLLNRPPLLRARDQKTI